MEIETELAALAKRRRELECECRAIEARIAELEGNEDRAAYYREVGTDLTAYPRYLAKRLLKGEPFPPGTEHYHAAALAMAETMRAAQCACPAPCTPCVCGEPASPGNHSQAACGA